MKYTSPVRIRSDGTSRPAVENAAANTAVGAPIVGDALYEGREEPGLGRFFLHARSLGLTHPVTHAPLKVESPLPEALRAVLARHGMDAPAA